MRIVILDAYMADAGGCETWPGLDDLGEVHRYDRTDAGETVARLAEASVAVTNKVVIDRDVLDACPQLRHVAVSATGVNVVDLAACAERGVTVSNVPAYSTASVAQHVFALILHHACGVAVHDKRVRVGDWVSSPDFSFLAQSTWELAGKHLAVIGHGAIGQAVIRIARGFDLAVDIVQLPWRPADPDRVPMNEALARADIISLHCPLTAETRGLVDSAFLQCCRDTLLLINTGRGPLLDEAAVAQWLTAHPRSRAAVDVLSSEPPTADNALLGHPQVTVTPHIAWATIEARRRLRAVVVENVARWSAGDPINLQG